jgi:c-di-GMP-binding flagellar brake protein YcgR
VALILFGQTVELWDPTKGENMSEETSTPRSDRRRSPRVKAEHELVLQVGEGAGFNATSVDLNLGGIYCTLDRHLPLFTKMHIGMALPVLTDQGTQHTFELGFEGVVVRMEPEEDSDDCSGYACAMAFVNVAPEAELVLAKYLLQSLGE